MPKRSRELINEELDAWSKRYDIYATSLIAIWCMKIRGVEGHWNHPYGRPWATVDELVKEPLAHLVGKVHIHDISIHRFNKPYRCQAIWSNCHEHLDLKYSFHADYFLSTHREEIQNLDWTKGISFRSCKFCLGNFSRFNVNTLVTVCGQFPPSLPRHWPQSRPFNYCTSWRRAYSSHWRHHWSHQQGRWNRSCHALRRSILYWPIFWNWKDHKGW